MTKEEIIEAVENMTVLELSELGKFMEDEFGISDEIPMFEDWGKMKGGEKFDGIKELLPPDKDGDIPYLR